MMICVVMQAGICFKTDFMLKPGDDIHGVSLSHHDNGQLHLTNKGAANGWTTFKITTKSPNINLHQELWVIPEKETEILGYHILPGGSGDAIHVHVMGEP